MGAIGNAVGGLFGSGAGPGSPINNYQANTANQDYGSLLANAQSNYNTAQSGQNQLAGQLQAQANGQGPNLAQQQLVQGTEANTQQGAGLIASQKGINPGLAARQVGMNTINANQQAAGQGAQIRAQQQLGAEQQLGQTYGNMGSLANNNLGTYEASLSGANQVNAQPAQQNAQFGQGLAGGLMGGLGSALGLAEGGMVPSPQNPQPVQPPSNVDPQKLQAAQDSMRKAFNFADGGVVPGSPSSFVTGFLNGAGASNSPNTNNPSSGYQTGSAMGKGAGMAGKGLYSMITNPMNGASSAVPSAAGGTVGGSAAGGATFAGADAGASLAPLTMMAAARGGPVPGKAMVHGNSYKNDVVPAMLSPKEIVLPRSVTQSKDPAGNAAKFVQALMARKGLK